MKAQPVDLEIRAWLMIHSLSSTSPGIFGRKRAEKELREHLRTLRVLPGEDEKTQTGTDAQSAAPASHVPDEDTRAFWEDFATRYIRLCLKSRDYTSTLLRMVPLSDEAVAQKLAQEIDLVTRDYPARFGLDEACAPFREAMYAVYERETG